MRGKVTVSSSSRVTMGITPAYAGKRNAMTVVKIVKKDHPRLCGEKSSVGLCSDKIIGSPPPMRGKDNIYFVKTDRDRITPAYAGKSRSAKRFPRQAGDHPRLCGEKCRVLFWKRGRVGSPPPMRGKVILLHNCRKTTGITPAYAGKSNPLQRPKQF